ncbi:MAG: DUF554 domain-containing protein [Clostridiales bacterium]|nr:DUF554 domain-containing protein [Clostridiales bacterium]
MFPTGVVINVLSVFFGGIIGAAAGNRLSDNFKNQLSSLFGICAMTMGISAITLMENMPAVIFAVIVGTAVGLALHFGEGVNHAAGLMQKPIAKILKTDASGNDEQKKALLVTIIVLFCASGTGIYGSIDAGMTGNHTVLISKSILDIFTALIFACQLGYVVSVIAIPQFIIFYALFLCAGLIYPLTTPTMINDFKACGGVLLLATGFRMLNLKPLPTADMIPAMILAMPCSWAWTNVIMPLL